MKGIRCVPCTGVRVLIAEDDQRLGAFLEEALAEAGWETDLCDTGPTALATALAGGYDVALLDWGLPGMTGPQIVTALRAAGVEVPVLLLTARGEVGDRVQGLDAGADDYLSKPFDLDELLARLRALLRRRTGGGTTAITVGDLRVDPAARRATRDGLDVRLSPREFDILVLLARSAGRVVDRYTILDEVWDDQTDLRSNSIDVHVASLRAKLDRPFDHPMITTVRAAGYRLDPTS